MTSVPSDHSLPTADDATATTEDLARGLRLLERELGAARRHGRRAPKQMYRLLSADLKAAEKRARAAERRAQAAEVRAERAEARARRLSRRVKTAEDELAGLRASATWRAGRAVVAVPARIKRLGKGRS